MCNKFIEIVNGKIVNAKPKSLLKGYIVCCDECGIERIDMRNKANKYFNGYAYRKYRKK